jgi:hypothetical protein
MLFANSGSDVDMSVPGARPHALLDYFAHTYHTASDVYDPDWNWTGAIADIQLYHAVGASFADGPEKPEWLDGAEFSRPRR